MPSSLRSSLPANRIEVPLVNSLLRWKNKPEPTAEDRRRLQQQRDQATEALKDAHQHLATWATEAKRWQQFEAEGMQAEQFADEVADVLRRQAGYVGSL